jgi:O-antigen ligase
VEPDAPTTNHGPAPAPRGWRWLADGGWIDRDAAEAAFARQHRRDRAGDVVHTVLAAAAAAALVGPTTATEIAFAPALVFFFVRTLNTGPTWVHWFGQPIGLACLAWAAWQGIALLWSPDRALGVEQLSEARWFVLGALVWPVIEQRRWIVLGLAVGLLAGMAAQGLHAWGRVDGRFGGPDWLVWPRYRNRNSGWWDPVVGGSVLVAALGLFVGPALRGRGWRRWAGIGGSACAAVAIAATGTRGAWIAGAALVLLATAVSAVAAVRRIGRGRAALLAGVAAAALAGAVAAGSLVASHAVRTRWNETLGEVRAALAGDLDTTTGHRVLMLRWAGEALLHRPVVGVGSGGYRAWALSHAPLAEGRVAAHAHNALAHAAACQGVVGALLLASIVALGVRGALLGTAPGTFTRSIAWALAGLVLVSAFDAVQVNAQTAALLGLLVGLCPTWRPGLGGRA